MKVASVFVLALTLAAAAAVPAPAADDTGAGVRMLVVPMSSRARYEAPYPIAVRLQNDGKPITAVIEACLGDPLEAPMVRQVANIGTGRFVFFLYPVATRHDFRNMTLHVRLLDSSDHVLDGFTQDVTPTEMPPYWMGTVEPPNRARIKGVLRLTDLVHMVPLARPEFLPDQWYGYRILDILLWDASVVPDLPAPQRRALADWVRGGGRLVLLVDDGDETFESPIPEALPTRRVQRPDSTNDLLFWWKEEPLGLGKVVFAQVGYRDKVVLSTDSIHTLLGTAFKASDSADIGPGMRSAFHLQFPEFLQFPDFVTETLRMALARAAGFTVLDFNPILAIMIVYILLVSVGDYFILRRFRRLHWTWLSFSLLIALFSAGSYVLFFERNLGSQQRHEIVLEDVGPDGQGRTMTLSVLRKNASRPLQFSIPVTHDLTGIFRYDESQYYGARNADRRFWRIGQTHSASPLKQVDIFGPVGSFQFFAEEWITEQPGKTEITIRPDRTPSTVNIRRPGGKPADSVYLLKEDGLHPMSREADSENWIEGPALAPAFNFRHIQKPTAAPLRRDPNGQTNSPVQASVPRGPPTVEVDHAARDAAGPMSLLQTAERLVTDRENLVSCLAGHRPLPWPTAIPPGPDQSSPGPSPVIVFAFYVERADHHGVPSDRVRCIRQICQPIPAVSPKEARP